MGITAAEGLVQQRIASTWADVFDFENSFANNVLTKETTSFFASPKRTAMREPLCISKIKHMKINNPEKRLKQFWGYVDQKHIKSLSEFLVGRNILDMGCGLGTTTEYITNMGHNCIGIDYDQDTIEYCKKTYPKCNFQTANAEELPFEDGYFDTIILRDALHHFYGEANFDKVKKEILRVLKDGSRIIFFDPNINFLLKTMRKISSHKDEECNYETATEIMKALDCQIIHHSFNTVYSLPLSGGYVGINFIPNIRFVQNIILVSEKHFESIINRIGLGRQLCWRYLIVGQK